MKRTNRRWIAGGVICAIVSCAALSIGTLRAKGVLGADVGRQGIASHAPVFGGVEEQRFTAEYPSLSPDGSRLLFVSNSAGTRDIWIADADGSHPAVVTPWSSSDEKQPSWFGNSSRIVFSSNRDGQRYQLWSMVIGSSIATQLTSDDADHEYPRVSPGNTSILYLSNATGKREMWTMNTDGTSQHPVALMSFLVSDPAFSPMDNQIVFVGCQRGGPCNLYKTNLDGSVTIKLTDGDYQDWCPDWGLNGILFASNRGDSQGVWIVQPDGTGVGQVTAPSGVADLDPRWAGNSDRFVFSRSGAQDAGAAADIWSVSSPGAPAERLTSIGVLSVTIDIKPGSNPNPINLQSHGVVPVAVLTTSAFNAQDLVPSSVVFGPASAVEAHGTGHLEDVDGDGDVDMVLHFRTQEIGIVCGDTSVTLTGRTAAGVAIRGTDSLITIGCP